MNEAMYITPDASPVGSTYGSVHVSAVAGTLSTPGAINAVNPV